MFSPRPLHNRHHLPIQPSSPPQLPRVLPRQQLLRQSYRHLQQHWCRRLYQHRPTRALPAGSPAQQALMVAVVRTAASARLVHHALATIPPPARHHLRRYDPPVRPSLQRHRPRLGVMFVLLASTSAVLTTHLVAAESVATVRPPDLAFFLLRLQSLRLTV